jgi:thiazole synthase ThiGH ThiG subunit
MASRFRATVGGDSIMSIAVSELNSRLILGTGKYKRFDLMRSGPLEGVVGSGAVL